MADMADGCRMSAAAVAAALSALPPGTPVAVEVMDGAADGVGYDVLEVQGATLLVQEPEGVDCVAGADCPDMWVAGEAAGDLPPRPPEAISRADDLRQAILALRRVEPPLGDARWAGECAGGVRWRPCWRWMPRWMPRWMRWRQCWRRKRPRRRKAYRNAGRATLARPIGKEQRGGDRGEMAEAPQRQLHRPRGRCSSADQSGA